MPLKTSQHSLRAYFIFLLTSCLFSKEAVNSMFVNFLHDTACLVAVVYVKKSSVKMYIRHEISLTEIFCVSTRYVAFSKRKK